jgi:hypothetical protein
MTVRIVEENMEKYLTKGERIEETRNFWRETEERLIGKLPASITSTSPQNHPLIEVFLLLSTTTAIVKTCPLRLIEIIWRFRPASCYSSRLQDSINRESLSRTLDLQNN